MATMQNKDQAARGKMRQHYHFMAQSGWLNDPNGLIYFRGKYHFFFQCNPYGGFWDCMYWGHAVSEDMLHWEYLPFALAPSEPYDDYPKGGCFSGSAIEHEGKLFLMYTGTSHYGKGIVQTQCIAYSEDGIYFKKYPGNPVITAPEGMYTIWCAVQAAIVTEWLCCINQKICCTGILSMSWQKAAESGE